MFRSVTPSPQIILPLSCFGLPTLSVSLSWRNLQKPHVVPSVPSRPPPACPRVCPSPLSLRIVSGNNGTGDRWRRKLLHSAKSPCQRLRESRSDHAITDLAFRTRLDKIGSFQLFSTFTPRLSFLQKLNWWWLGGWIFLPCHFFCTGALTAEKLTIWPNCSFHTETSKAKWIQFGWQCWSDKLGSNEKRTMVLNPCSFGGWIICCIFLKNGYSCSILKVKV